MSKLFLKGFVIGVLVKDKLLELINNIVFNTMDTVYKIQNKTILNKNHYNSVITDIQFICKIKNNELFKEVFNNRFQPGWKYFSEKNILKIELDYDILFMLNKQLPVQKSISVEEFYNLKDKDDSHFISLDIPLFKHIGDIYLFVEYYYDNRKYINVYDQEMNISYLDFKVNKEDLLFNNIICSSVNIKNRNEYITNYLKLFNNNLKIALTPEIILINYDKVNTDLKNTSLSLVMNKSIKTYLYNDSLNYLKK